MYSSDNPFLLAGNPEPYPSPQAAGQGQQTNYSQQQGQYLPEQQPNTFYAPGQYPPGQFPPAPGQQQPTNKNCCKSSFMKGFVIFSIFAVGAVLIGAVGVLCPFLLFTDADHDFRVVPSYIFSIYCIVFGALMILVQIRIRFIVNFFLFLASFYHRAVFIMFLGTLCMSAYSKTEKFQWIGYVLGGFIILIGILHIVVGCSDVDWVKEQNAKFLEHGNETAPSAQQNDASGAPQNALDAFYGTPGAPEQAAAPGQYPSLASDSSMMSQNADPRKQMAAQAAQMPETQQFAAAATTATVQNMFAGQSAENAAASAFSNPQVQSLAFNAGVAAARNPAMQNAAKNATANALSNAYDQLFE